LALHLRRRLSRRSRRIPSLKIITTITAVHSLIALRTWFTGPSFYRTGWRRWSAIPVECIPSLGRTFACGWTDRVRRLIIIPVKYIPVPAIAVIGVTAYPLITSPRCSRLRVIVPAIPAPVATLGVGRLTIVIIIIPVKCIPAAIGYIVIIRIGTIVTAPA
jgi:hypothetical protein